LVLMPGSRKLRGALADAQAIRFPTVYVETLNTLQREFGHSIVLRDEGREQIRQFNCFAYALGVWDNPVYQEMVGAHAEDQLALINSALVSKWIDEGFLSEIQPGDAGTDDIVAYFYRGQLAHFARFGSAGLLRSKWGGNEVHEHRMWEVPADYGNKVRYFRRPEAEAILAQLAKLE
jgi:hypothetical protein